jgi:hypothetical protein
LAQLRNAGSERVHSANVLCPHAGEVLKKVFDDLLRNVFESDAHTSGARGPERFSGSLVMYANGTL